MKKRTLLASVALTALLAACGKTDSPAPQAAATPEPAPAAPAPEVRKIVVGLDDNFPPMGFRNEANEIVGFDIDMAREVAQRIGMEVEFKPIEWSAKEAELIGRRVDVLWNGLTITQARKEKIAFTAPYMSNHQIIVVKAGSDITNKATMAGKVVGVQEGSSALQAIHAETEVATSFKEIKQFGDNITALLDLEAGRLDAVVLDEVVGRFHVVKKPTEYAVLEENFGTEDYGVGLRKDDTELLEKVDATLAEMKRDGTAERIAVQWFGKNVIK